MNSADFHDGPSPSVSQAEQAVNNSLANFETAIERLNDKVEPTRALIESIRTNPSPYMLAGAMLGAGLIYFYAVAREPESPYAPN